MIWYLLADPAPGTNQGMTISSETLDAAIKGSSMFVNSFKNDWTQIVEGTSPVYTSVVAISMLIAVVLVSFWSLHWYGMFSEEGFSTNVMREMAMPLIVILLLANNGALLAKGTMALRNTTVTLNSNVLKITRNGVTLKDAIRTVNFDQHFTFALQAALVKCEKLDEKDVDTDGTEYSPRQDCIDRTINTAQKEAQKIRQQRGLNAGSGIRNPLAIGKEIINGAIQGVIFVIFSGLAAAFQYIVQLSFLLVAYIAPIFLVLSLLPVSTKAIYAWLSGWLGLTMVLVSYSIIVGISASSIVNSPSTDPILSQLIIAVLSPILAMAIGTGTAMSTFTAFSSGIKFAAGIRR
ncbi:MULTISPECIES: type IV secretion system protein [unclassified Nostoc]|uniref:type IV secretion system protein n=1 Tax=unclassified Nostoc TaxID=2593658 RepID=UPI001F554F7E|nr:MULTISPECIES: type IV secretion system protein [unclassified Nostoc]